MSLDSERKIVHVSWRYPVEQSRVFEAIAEGRLLMTCGSKMSQFHHEFRVGGLWQAVHDGDEPCRMKGKYLEIAAPNKVRFTWEDPFTPERKGEQPSEVTVTLSRRGGFTCVDLVHEKVSSLESAHSFHQGWTEVLALLRDRLDGTRLYLCHDLKASIAAIRERLSTGDLFQVIGTNRGVERSYKVGDYYRYDIGTSDFIEGRITKSGADEFSFTWSTLNSGKKVEDTGVRIELQELDNTTTRLHLTHDGFTAKEVSDGHRTVWHNALTKFAHGFL